MELLGGWTVTNCTHPHKRTALRCRACENEHRRSSRAETFWSHVEKTEDCWLWCGSLLKSGYGQVSMRGFGASTMSAHRAAWLLTNGPILEGGWVLHHCDNPPCVRPSHLYIGNSADNTRDMLARQRHFQQQKTHCPQGHPYDEANTQRWHGQRICRTCHRAHHAAYKARLKIEHVTSN